VKTEGFRGVAPTSTSPFPEKIPVYPVDRGISAKPQEIGLLTTGARTNQSKRVPFSKVPLRGQNGYGADFVRFSTETVGLETHDAKALVGA
jgi:hypothetical protein